RYILSIESAEEIEEYVGDLIQGRDGKKRQFIDELLEKWQRSRQRAPESVQLYRRNEEMDTEISETMRGCDALKKSKRKGRNKQETMIYTEQAPGPEEVKTPIDLAKAQESSPSSSSSSSFKKKKFVSLYAKEGQDKLAILLPGRHPCECLAQKHKLINNCLTCGRIICEQEGSGPCLFCGSLVIDDQSDYFSTDSNQWLSQAEREALRKRGEELQELRHASRQGRKITFDFAGRQILEEGEKMTEYYSKFDDTVHALNTGSLGQSSKPADCGPRQHLRELVNPNIIQAAPVWVDLNDPAPLRKPQSSQLKGSRSDPSAERTRLRIQDKELQEIADDGWVEGRTWYSSHRGRLWIAAAGKRPTPQEISQVEASYRTMYKRVPEFPKEYPTGCLLGCVNMADCLSQEQFREQVSASCFTKP
ncbi:UNVERIFIED_CONTAM: hypothetical protein FKN15_008900, partial [Acipenser sinensis]